MINRKIISLLARQDMRLNRRRTVFASLAIALTTLLFTSLFTLGGTLISSFEEETMRQVGTKAHGGFKDLTDDEFERLTVHPSLKQMEYSIALSIAENRELQSRQTQIQYETPGYAEWGFTLPEEGHLPQQNNELATDTIVLDLLGIEHRVGEPISLSYDVDGELYTDDFILSGFWRGDSLAGASIALVSESFTAKRLEGVDQEKIKSQMDHAGLYNVAFMLSSSRNIEEKITTIIAESGYGEDDINYGVNWAYMSTRVEDHGELIAFMIGTVLLIGWTGYLIIFNIFQLSVSMDIRFYGMLKTIGTTNRQIRSYIHKQALMLCLAGIPVGLILGYGLGIALFPLLRALFDFSVISHSVSPWIFIFSTLFALITVYISSLIPARAAARITPIEGVRYAEEEPVKRNRKPLRQGNRVLQLAVANLKRQPRKLILVILSLSLSLVILNGVNSFASSFDMDLYIRNFAIMDYQVANGRSLGHQKYSGAEDSVSEEIIELIKDQPWFDLGGEVSYVLESHILEGRHKERYAEVLTDEVLEAMNPMVIDHYRETVTTGEVPIQVYGLDSLLYEKMDFLAGVFDKEKFESGKYVIISPIIGRDEEDSWKSFYNPGEKLTLTMEGEEPRTYEVMAIGKVPYSLSVQYFSTYGFEVILPRTEFETILRDDQTLGFHFNVKEGHEEECYAFLENFILKINPELVYRSKEIYRQENTRFVFVLRIVGGALVTVIALIGLLNYFNTALTGIHTRRKEFALLQSIGMTRGQLKKMLCFEGLVTGLLTIAFTVLGIVLTAGPLINFLSQSWVSTGKLTFTTTYVAVPIILVIALVVPILSFQYKGRSVIEVLRESE